MTNENMPFRNSQVVPGLPQLPRQPLPPQVPQMPTVAGSFGSNPYARAYGHASPYSALQTQSFNVPRLLA
jgi:hypothetical protein